MWHEARRSERKVHDMMDAARKRAQRRAVYLAKKRGDPRQSIQAIGGRCRTHRDDALYRATEEEQGLIPWNGKQDVMIDRFDGRALLDFIREPVRRGSRSQEKTEEEEELEEFVNFERYRDLIKHRRRGFSDEEGLQHVNQVIEEKAALAFSFNSRSNQSQPPATKGAYSQVGFSYDGDFKDENNSSDGDDDDDEDEDDEEEFNSDDSNDEGMEVIAKDFGVKRYGWLVYMDKKAKEEEKRQKEVIKGDPSVRKLSRKERRKASQLEREKDRESSRTIGLRTLQHDPYRESRRSPTYEAYCRSRRSRSRSRSYSPSRARHHGRGHADDGHRSKSKAPKIEFITEFGGSPDREGPKLEGPSPPSSPPPQAHVPNRPSSDRILEALHVDPASGVPIEKEKSVKATKPSAGPSMGMAKLSKGVAGGSLKQPQSEKKETPQERLKRIMSKQLNKQIKKDSAAEMAKKREQERQRLEKLAETNRLGRYRHRSRSRSYSRSPPRRYSRHRSRSRSRERSRERSKERSRERSSRRRHSRSRSKSKSLSPASSRSRSHSRSRSTSRSPRRRSRSRY